MLGLNKYDAPKYQEISIDELQQLIQQWRVKNNWIHKENQLFNSYIKRITISTISIDSNEEPDSLILTPEQRFLIATSELKEIRDEIDKTKESSERFLEQLRVGSG